VCAVHQHFGFDNRHDVLLLTKRGITRERVRIRFDAGGARQRIADGDHRAPFGEARAHLAVLLQAVAQPIESLGDRFSGRAGERFGAVVDFDARDLKNLTSISEEGETVLLELMNERVTVRASGVFAKEVLKQLARKCAATVSKMRGEGGSKAFYLASRNTNSLNRDAFSKGNAY
jgi:hypothetical protein